MRTIGNMTIVEIMPLFLKGEKIRREAWDKNAYMYKDGIHIHSVYSNNGTSGDYVTLIAEQTFALDDIMGNDWTTKI